MKKSILFVFLSLCLMIGVLCSTTQAAEPLKIGVLVPLTGGAAPSGLEMRNGYLAALKEAEEKGGLFNGQKIELIFEDSKGNTSAAIGALEKLINKDKVTIVMGALSSTVFKALSGPMKKYQPIFLSAGGSASALEPFYENSSDWFFHYHPWDYVYTKVIGDAMKDLGGLGKFVVAHEEGVWGATTVDMLEKILKGMGHQVVGRIPFKSGSPDFSSVIAQAKMKPHDYLVVFTYPTDVNTFVPQMKQLNYNPKFSVFALPGWPDNFGKLPESEYIGVEGMWFPQWKLPESQNFVKYYVKASGMQPRTYWGPMAYVNLNTLVESINRAKSTDKKAIAKALQTGKWKTPMGPLKFTKSKWGINDGYDYEIVMQWRNGQMEVVWPKNLETKKAVIPVPAWDKR